ncbi:hypothetical protein [Paenibacillus jilunlii]|uniref:ABC-2 family transporter protein n=2 Tax=Paenibacillus jilunlii TaxID=682956 RepID=A0A1G9NG89_9BACL|nr:hypothetical protein [Paenibacillus jilunlii]SDL85373.1 hypothetical protein SAMN05216191_106172 [Paenibacillus jilunlii]
MNKLTVMLKASFLQLKLYLYVILGVVAVSVLANIIVSLSVGIRENSQVSAANLFTVFLVFVGSILPVQLFRRVVNLGATRKDYYYGILVVYVLCAAFFAVLNTVWFELEVSIIRSHESTYNILEIFGWSQFGIAGMLIYQFGAYLMLLSLLSLLFSGMRHIVGWIIWVIILAAIPVFTSIAPLRHKLANGLMVLLFNDSLLAGFGLTFLISCVLLAGGWCFTAKRSIF